MVIEAVEAVAGRVVMKRMKEVGRGASRDCTRLVALVVGIEEEVLPVQAKDEMVAIMVTVVVAVVAIAVSWWTEQKSREEAIH